MTAAPSPAPVVLTDLQLEWQQIPTRYTGGLSEVRSLGTEIIWAATHPTASDGHPSVFRYMPGTDQPELIYRYPREYRSPMRDGGLIGYVAGSSAGYAFSEYDTTPFGYGPWRLWYVPSPGADPILLDSSEDDGDLAPMVAMNDRYVAWTSSRGPWLEKTSELRIVDVDDLDHPATLRSIKNGGALFPVIHGNELWFGWSEYDPDTGKGPTRVEMIDLDNPDRPTLELGEDMEASMPAANDDVVVWRASEPDIGIFNSGTLTVYWRKTRTVDRLPIPGDPRTGDRVSYPSVGARFVAWHDELRTRLYLYDLQQRQFRRVVEWDPKGKEGSIWHSVAGNLLAIRYFSDDKHSFLRWAWLPD